MAEVFPESSRIHIRAKGSSANAKELQRGKSLVNVIRTLFGNIDNNQQK